MNKILTIQKEDVSALCKVSCWQWTPLYEWDYSLRQERLKRGLQQTKPTLRAVELKKSPGQQKEPEQIRPTLKTALALSDAG